MDLLATDATASTLTVPLVPKSLCPSEWAAYHLATIESPHAKHFHQGLELHIDPISEDEVERSGFTRGAWIVRLPPLKNDERMYAPPLVQRFGTSGWNFQKQCSEFVGFDFDATDHSGRKVLTPEQLAAVQDAAATLDYVEVYSSKGGQGRHFYVHLEQFLPAETREEHKLVAHGIISQMNRDAGFDFAKHVDVYGQLVWLWDRNAKPDGLKLLKRASRNLLLAGDWREHALRQSKTTALKRLSKRAARTVVNLTASQTEMDDEHRKLAVWCQENSWAFEVQELNEKPLLQVHTAGLKAYAEQHPVRGFFDTVSAGTDGAKPNAFAFLLPEGGLTVRRHGNVAEASCWRECGDWRVCKFNVIPTFDEACQAAGGVLNQRQRFVFCDGRESQALKYLGIDFLLPEALQGRDVIVWRDGQRIHVNVREDRKSDPRLIHGWTAHRLTWEHTINTNLPVSRTPASEHLVRHTVTEKDGGQDWMIADAEGRWQRENMTAAEKVLTAEGLDRTQAAEVLAHHLRHNWTVRNVPFAAEYLPGVRQWNRNAARLAFEPSPGAHPHWDMVFAHCGRELDAEVGRYEWCREHGIRSGADYLRMWAAILFRRPDQPLPYLFLHGEAQDSGKSSFHRGLCIFFEDGRGSVEIKKELTKDDFNGVMEGAPLLYIEEIDLSQSYVIYNAIKNYVETERLKVRGIYRAGQMTVNYSHWVHTANSLSYCPIPPGDTRIVALHVTRPETIVVWRDVLKPKLIDEAPAFLHTLHSIEFPKVGATRLFLPIVETRSKRQAMADWDAKFRGWYYELRELAIEGAIIKQTAGEILQLLTARTSDSQLPANPGALGKRLMRDLKERLIADGFDCQYEPNEGRKNPTFTIKAHELVGLSA